GAWGAGPHSTLGWAGRGAAGVAAGDVRHPRHALSFVEPRTQPFRAVSPGCVARRPLSGPFEMPRPGTVTAFAADADLGPPRLKPIGCAVVVLANGGWGGGRP